MPPGHAKQPTPPTQLHQPAMNQARLPLSVSAAALTGVVPPTSGGTGTPTPQPQNRVIVAGAAGVYTSHADLVFDLATGRLGVGTAAPAEKLHVVGTARISSLSPGNIVFPVVGGVLSGSANLFFDSANSRLGLGTATPEYAVDVEGMFRSNKNGPSQGTTQLNGAIGAGDATITVDSTTGFGTSGVINVDLELITYTGKTATTFTGCLRGRFGTTAAAHADNATLLYIGFAQFSDDGDQGGIFLAANGNVWIAPNALSGGIAASPAATRAAFKVSHMNYDANSKLMNIYDGTQGAMMGVDGTNIFYGSRTSHPVAIRTNNVARLFVTTTGLLQLAGVTSAFPALKRASATLEVRLADDSAYAELRALRAIVDAGDRVSFAGRTRITSPVDGQLLLTDDAAATFARLMLGGTSSSFPAMKRNAAVLEVKLADDSDFTELKAKVLRISDGTFMLRSAAAMNNGAGASAGTLTNAPSAGDPTKWISRSTTTARLDTSPRGDVWLNSST